MAKIGTANEIPTDCIETPWDAVAALCRLQAEVSENVHEYQRTADCFCGERQEWVERGVWGNEGEAIRFIVEATREKMAAVLNARGE